jgi:hypothetical protein
MHIVLGWRIWIETSVMAGSKIEDIGPNIKILKLFANGELA